MTKVLIFGAHGQIARVTTELFLDKTDAHLTLYLRNAGRLGHPPRLFVITGFLEQVNRLSGTARSR